MLTGPGESHSAQSCKNLEKGEMGRSCSSSYLQQASLRFSPLLSGSHLLSDTWPSLSSAFSLEVSASCGACMKLWCVQEGDEWRWQDWGLKLDTNRIQSYKETLPQTYSQALLLAQLTLCPDSLLPLARPELNCEDSPPRQFHTMADWFLILLTTIKLYFLTFKII